MKAWAFGVPAGYHAGHYLQPSAGDWPVEFGGRTYFIHGRPIDCGFAPTSHRTHGVAEVTHIEGLTVLGMWDYSADKRHNCNFNLIAEGTHSTERMLEIFAERFPREFARIRPEAR